MFQVIPYANGLITLTGFYMAINTGRIGVRVKKNLPVLSIVYRQYYITIADPISSSLLIGKLAIKKVIYAEFCNIAKIL